VFLGRLFGRHRVRDGLGRFRRCFAVDPAIATTPARRPSPLGGSDSDGATVYGTTAGGDPTGTVTFYECGPTATPMPCTSEADPVGNPVTLTAGAADTATAPSAAFTPAAAGDWCFAGYYSGDGNYAAGSDTTIDEMLLRDSRFITTPPRPRSAWAPPTPTRAQSPATPRAGYRQAPSPSIHVDPRPPPHPAQRWTTPVGNPVTLTAGTGDTPTATSPAFTATAVGDWCFAGYYAGDGNYARSSDTSTDECFLWWP